MTRVFCDRCAKELTEVDIAQGTWPCFPWVPLEEPIGKDMSRLDMRVTFCAACDLTLRKALIATLRDV